MDQNQGDEQQTRLVIRAMAIVGVIAVAMLAVAMIWSAGIDG